MHGALHHVELYVRDLKTSLDFWGWFLSRMGYELYQSWEEGASYLLGDCYLVFVQIEERWKDVPYHRCRAGLNHLAFHARDEAFVDEITSELRARGITILYEDRHPHASGEDAYSVFFEDPDRMKVELTVTTL